MNNDLIIYGINKIVFVGENEYNEVRTTFKSKNLKSHELIYNFIGEATVYFNNQIFITKPNQIRYLPKGECTKYIVDRKTKGECIDIFFTSNVPLDENAFVVPIKNEKISQLFKKIFSVWVQKDEGYYLECLSILYKILSEMQKTTYLADKQFEKIKPAVEYIENNFLNKETISSQKLVSLCNISYSYIKRLFNLKYMISPKRYILQLKMKYACKLLQHGEYSVSEIADICGYSDIYTFSHQFKREFGLSPIGFTKKYKSSK